MEDKRKYTNIIYNDYFNKVNNSNWVSQNHTIKKIFADKILDSIDDSRKLGAYFMYFHRNNNNINLFNFKISEFITVPLYVKKGNTKCIFGFIYYYAGCVGDKTPVAQFISLGTTLTSADGEYRTYFYPFVYFKLRLDYYQKDIDKIKNDLTEDVDLLSEIIIPIYTTNENNNKNTKRDLKIEKYINKDISDNIENYYSYCYLFYIYHYKFKIIENHVYKNFIDILFSNKKLYNYALKEFDIKYIYIEITNKNFAFGEPTRCGQKIIPITINEFNNFKNIKESLWREIFIKEKINTLLYNGLTYSIPYYMGWFLINSNSNLIYDNDISKLKILYSDFVKNEIKKINSIKNNIDKIEQKNVLILSKIQTLQKTLDIPIKYAENNIILSKSSLCIVDTYKGIPIADITNRVLSTEHTVSSFTSQIFQDIEHFNFIIFKILYNLLVFNKFYNIIHGDLHMNNILMIPISGYILASILKLIPDKNKQKKIIPKDLYAYELYNLNYEDEDENENENIFILNFGYYIPTIIDFSRAFIYKSENIDNNIITNELTELYKKKIISLLKYELREFYKENKLYILHCMTETFDKFYQIFKAFDAYKFSNGFINIVNSVKCNIKFDKEYIENSHLKLVIGIKSFALNFIKKYIYLLYEDNTITIPDINKLIIVKFFTQYNLNNIKKINTGEIRDTFNINNKIDHKFTETNRTFDIYEEKLISKFSFAKKFQENFDRKTENDEYLKNCNYEAKIEYLKKNNQY